MAEAEINVVFEEIKKTKSNNRIINIKKLIKLSKNKQNKKYIITFLKTNKKYRVFLTKYFNRYNNVHHGGGKKEDEAFAAAQKLLEAAKASLKDASSKSKPVAAADVRAAKTNLETAETNKEAADAAARLSAVTVRPGTATVANPTTAQAAQAAPTRPSSSSSLLHFPRLFRGRKVAPASPPASPPALPPASPPVPQARRPGKELAIEPIQSKPNLSQAGPSGTSQAGPSGTSGTSQAGPSGTSSSRARPPPHRQRVRVLPELSIGAPENYENYGNFDGLLEPTYGIPEQVIPGFPLRKIKNWHQHEPLAVVKGIQVDGRKEYGEGGFIKHDKYALKNQLEYLEGEVTDVQKIQLNEAFLISIDDKDIKLKNINNGIKIFNNLYSIPMPLVRANKQTINTINLIQGIEDKYKLDDKKQAYWIASNIPLGLLAIICVSTHNGKVYVNIVAIKYCAISIQKAEDRLVHQLIPNYNNYSYNIEETQLGRILNLAWNTQPSTYVYPPQHPTTSISLQEGTGIYNLSYVTTLLATAPQIIEIVAAPPRGPRQQTARQPRPQTAVNAAQLWNSKIRFPYGPQPPSEEQKIREEKLKEQETILNTLEKNGDTNTEEYVDGIDYEPIKFDKIVYKIGKIVIENVQFTDENGKSEVLKYPKLLYHYYKGEIDPNSQDKIPPPIIQFFEKKRTDLIDPNRNVFSKAALSILKSTGEVIINDEGNPIQSRGGKRKPKSRSKSAK